MKNNKLAKLEAIRGFSALYVVFFHMLPQKIYVFGINIGFLFRFGSEAVIMFLILSGFVIKYTWEKNSNKTFKTYFLKRFVRIYVPLLFIFILAYVIKCFAEGGLANPDVKTLLGNLLMLQDVISLKPNVISATYMGNGVLWSLSYEWWFYMLFFLLSSRVKSTKLNKYVNIITVIATISYLFYPFILNRIVMYFAIWWIGVRFAETYLNNKTYTFSAIKNYTYILLIILGLLGLNLYINFEYTKTYKYPLVAFPFVELRHFTFAFIAMFTGVLWNKLNWFGFDKLFGIFKYIAPFSYVIYISHHYLVVEASYLSFINNKIVEYTLYFLLMLLFSYLVEVVFYPKIKKRIMSYYAINF
ncbi:acyltransferase family protein [Polaribacter sp.]|uniref:acyltransferase family protein n=1 Tax=Polaribacter sp. TaxID=1920175 RepID=UPI003F6A5DAA